MTKTEREYVTKLNAEMPEFTGTPTEVQEKIAMYIYLKLGKSKVFDERWFFGNKSEREKIEKIYNREKSDIGLLIKKRKLVCITISSLYSRLLKDFGLKCKTEQLYTNDNHVSNVISLNNGEKIVVDLQKDLENIQIRGKTKYFGLKYRNGVLTGQKISDEELFELHKSCGYVEKENDYMDGKIKEFSKKVEGLEADEILEKILFDKSLKGYQEDIGYIELFKFYTRVVYEVVPKMDKVKIHYCNCYRYVKDENGKDEKEYSMCMYSIIGEKIKAYLYSNKEKCFKPIDLETFAKLEREGLFIGKNQQESGVKLLRRHINKAVEESIKRKNSENFKRNSFNMKDIR